MGVGAALPWWHRSASGVGEWAAEEQVVDFPLCFEGHSTLLLGRLEVASRDPQARPQGHSHLSTSEVAIARALLTIPEQSAAFSSAAAASSSSSPFIPSALPKRTLASAPRRAGAMTKLVGCAVSAPSVSISSAGQAAPMATLRCSTCPECGKIFRGDYHKYNLKKHLTIHAGLRPFPCPVCNLAFNQKVSMKRHFASVHRSVDPIAPVSQ